jgi:neutral ceramidase
MKHLITSLLIIAASIGSAAAAESKLQAGAATSVITPPLGEKIVGGFAPFPSTHIHDDLHARCLVLDDGQTKLALVVCDLLGMHRIVSDEARRLIQEETRIPKDNVLISATHTHSASSALGQNRFSHEQTLDDYQKFVARRIADGVRCAINNLRPAELGYGSVEAPEHVNNRRWHLKPGSMPDNPFGEQDLVKMNPPAGSPNLVEPAGPTDPTVSFIAMRGTDGKPISVCTTYSLHYVGGVGNGHISADYFGIYCAELARLMEAERLDPPFVALMANGTSGDINNINFRQPRLRMEPYEQMRFVANDVAKKVHAALADVKYRTDITLAARYREPEIAWRIPSEERLAWAKKALAAGPKVPGQVDLSVAYAERALAMADYPPTTKVPLQVLRIGEIGIGTMPCEVFCEIGIDFRNKSPLQPAFMVSLNHGYFGYLPTPRHHKLGGYETWLGTNRLEVEASDKLLAELLAMAEEMDFKLSPEVRERCLAVLRAGLASDEFWPAMHAAEALTYAGRTAEVLTALAKRSAADDQQRCGLAREAFRAVDVSKAAELLSILADETSNGRVHAAESLFKVNHLGDGKGLKAAAAQDENLKLKLMAAAALARAGDAGSLAAIRKYLPHGDVEVRKVAVWILGQLGDESDVLPIQQSLDKEQDELARAYCVNALACLGDANAKEQLVANLSSSNPAVKVYSADFAGHAKAKAARDKLIELLEDETLDVRVRAAQSLILLAK